MKRYVVEATLIDKEENPPVKRIYKHVVRSDSRAHAESEVRTHYAHVQEVWEGLIVTLHTKVMS